MTEETLFAEALAKGNPAERAAYLDKACAGAPALRRRVEALLASHKRGGDFLEHPAVEQMAASPPPQEGTGAETQGNRPGHRHRRSAEEEDVPAGRGEVQRGADDGETPLSGVAA